jgi:hypothetical protein
MGSDHNKFICNSIGRWYVTYDVTLSLLAPYPTERLDVILHQNLANVRLYNFLIIR